jgi:hypothetical protein
MELTRNHISYLDKKTTLDIDNLRLWFIANQEPTTDHEFYEAKLLSRYWQNIKQLKCEYCPQIMRRVKDHD